MKTSTRFTTVKKKSEIKLIDGKIFCNGEDITPLGMLVDSYKVVNGTLLLFITENILIIKGRYFNHT